MSYWTYNLPLQLWPVYGEDDDSEDAGEEITDYRILNYMPRRGGVCDLLLSELLHDGQTREQFLEQAALVFENMARLFRAAKDDPNMTIYYPDEGMKHEQA
jgi:hypothetical protein